MVCVTSHVMVPFEGEGAGDGPMTWAQHMMWQTMRESGRSMNIGGTVALPAGTPVEAMARMLCFLVSRHQALRTRLRFVPDGPPRQVVSASGEAVLEVVDLAAGDDPDAAAEELRDRYASAEFDHEVEWPIRMGVIRRDGLLSHAVLMYCHLAVDSFGIDELVRDLAHLDQVTGAAPARLTPLETAAGQQTAAGVRKSQKSLRYWERLLRTLPVHRPVPSHDAREPRFWELTVRSPAMLLALRAITHRTGIESAFVVLAAYAVARARYTGGSPVAAQLVVNNRFRPGCADSVSLLVQNGLCVIDVADVPFDEVLERAWTAATNAFLHGYYDPAALTDLRDRVLREHGATDISYLVNDRRTDDPAAAPAPTADQVKAAVPLTTSWWSRKLDSLSYTVIVNVDDAPDAVDMAILADTHRMAPAGIEAFARDLETVLVDAARHQSGGHDAGAE